MRQEHSWETTIAFWNVAEPLVSRKQRNPNREYQRNSGGGRPSMNPRKVLEAIFHVLQTGIRWNALCP
jgi:transposase